MRYWRLGTILVLASLLLLGVVVWGVESNYADAAPPLAREPIALPLSSGSTITTFVTTFSTTTISIPTYPYTEHLTTAYNPTYNITYTVLDWGSYDGNASPIPVTYTLLVLENPYLRVTLLPELGGRVYQMIYKATGSNELYQNPVIKPTRWGPPEQGWWLAAGGIEWALPVEEHGYEWGIPWAWDVITSAQGITVTVRDTDAVDRLTTRVALFLPSDRAYLAVTPRIENPTVQDIDYKFWLNAALVPGPENKPPADLEFVFNAEQVTVHSTGDPRLPGVHPNDPTGPDHQITWPVYNGVDYSRLGNWQGWFGFFEYPQAVDNFVGVYNHAANEGIARVFPRDVAQGVKGFGTGWGEGAIPWTIWTDENSGGIEIHGGKAPTFWDTATLPAGGAHVWTEYWYPVGGIGDLTVATQEAALNLRIDNGRLRAGIHPTRLWEDEESAIYIWNRETCELLTEHPLPPIGPSHPYTLNVVPDEWTLDDVAIAYAAVQTRAALATYNLGACEIPPPMPEAHLGYGINVRKMERISSLADPLGFEWVKVWEEYNALPTERLPYQVLYILDCRNYINNSDPEAWGNHVEDVARAGQGKIEAYEICNEPNVKSFWNNISPDPARFAEMLCIANDRIKAVDPDVSIISGGLAPVGRVPGEYESWQGHDGDKMDEQLYLQGMLDSGAGACIDAFGYHPYGFNVSPETRSSGVSNGFSFRGAEAMRQLLVDNGLETMPVWATEFNWLRDPAEDGQNCLEDPTYKQYFEWMIVSAETQGEYLRRAFKFADRYLPWMEGMFVWNLDWYDFELEGPCGASRYFSLRWDDGSFLGGARPAYQALASMPKRSAFVLPELHIRPRERTYLVDVDERGVLTHTVSISNIGQSMLKWAVASVPSGSLTPTLLITQGIQGEALSMTIDTADLNRGVYTSGTITLPQVLGVYTRTFNISAFTEGETLVLGSPQTTTLTIHIVPEVYDIFLPVIGHNYRALGKAGGPHGPSKLGVHTIASGGTVNFVREVKDGGARVALVKAVSDFGYLKEVKQISPETVTIGRWADKQWEAIDAVGDPAQKAAEYMAVHMAHWGQHRAYVDYWEVLNEADPPTIEQHAWLAEFFIAAMNIAEANDYKLALFSYSMGVPEWYEWEAMVETGVFARAKAGGHILSLHEYGEYNALSMSAGWGEPIPLYPGQPIDERPRFPDRGIYTGRYRHLYEDFLIPRDEVIPLAITECNLAIDDPAIRNPVFVEEMIWYDDRLREDDYVIGMAIFTLGGGGWDHFDFAQFLPDLRDHIIAVKDE